MGGASRERCWDEDGEGERKERGRLGGDRGGGGEEGETGGARERR